MKRSNVMTWALVVGSLPLVACGPTSTSGDDEGGADLDLAKIAVDNTEHALLGAHSAGSFIADSQTFADALTTLQDDESCQDLGCPIDDPSCIPQEECTPDEVTVAELQEQRADLREGIDDLIQSMREDFFGKAKVEGRTGSSVTYLLGPEVLCGEVVAEDPGAPVPPPAADPMYDPECVDEVNDLKVRLQLTLVGPGNVDMAVLLTDAKRNPVTFEFHRDHIGVSSDLAELKATLDAAGEDTSNIPTLEGKVGFELRENTNLDWSFLANVLQNVVVVVADEETQEQVRVGLGASAPSMEFRLNGNARNVQGSIDYGALSVSGPLNAFRDSFDEIEYDPVTGLEIPRPTYTGNVELMIGGYEGSVTFDGSTDHLTLAGLGFGNVPSTLKWDNQILAQLDLNPSNGRHFDLGYQKTNAGSEFTFSPTLEAILRLNFAPLASQIADISPSLMDDTIRVWFDGQDPKIEVKEEQVKVVAGTFNVTSTATPEANLSVPAGMCIVDSGATDPANEAIGAVTMGTCQ